MTRLRAVLFDMGNVLLDMGNASGLPSGKLDFRGREAIAQAVRRGGGKVSPEELERLVFAPWRAEYERRYETGREASWEPHMRRLRRAARTRLRDLTLLGHWFAPYAESLRPISGARDAVRALAGRGLRLAIVSNVPLPGKLYEAELRRHRLLRRFAHREWSYDAGSRKPSPAMLRRALAALDAEPAEAVMVGDRRRSDIAAGRAAGVRTVWLRTADGGGPAPDLEIDTLAELPGVLGIK